MAPKTYWRMQWGEGEEEKKVRIVLRENKKMNEFQGMGKLVFYNSRGEKLGI